MFVSKIIILQSLLRSTIRAFCLQRQLVVVKKLDGTKQKGYISQKGDDSFTLTDSKTKQTTIIAYSDVAQVKKPLSGDTIALTIIGGAAAVAAIVFGSLLLKRCRNEGGC